MVPRLVDTAGIDPRDRWDFTERTYFLNSHAQVSMGACKLCVSDCILYDGLGFADGQGGTGEAQAVMEAEAVGVIEWRWRPPSSGTRGGGHTSI